MIKERVIDKRKAASFESVASIYARVRPGYAEAVYQEIEAHKFFSANSVPGEKRLQEFYRNVHKVIAARNSRIKVTITADLNIAEKVFTI